MLITGKRGLPFLLRTITDLLLILNLLALIGLPWILSGLFANPDLLAQLSPGTGLAAAAGYPVSGIRSDMPASSYTFYLIFLYFSGIGTGWVLVEGHLILRRLEKGDPFASGQAGSFRRMSAACALLAACFAVKIIRYNTVLTMFCGVIFLILVLITLIMAEIFRQAYIVKTENELTI